MDPKTQKLTQLKEEFFRWEQLLANRSESQLTGRRFEEDRSIKDILAHLLTWQKLSIARVEAALHGLPPQSAAVPGWPAGLDPDQEDVDALNEWMYTANRDRSWASVYREWNTGFLHLLELAQSIPAADLEDDESFLSQVLHGTYEHHHIDHYEPLKQSLNAE